LQLQPSCCFSIALSLPAHYRQFLSMPPPRLRARRPRPLALHPQKLRPLP
jgi:hypothetical protein